MVRSKIGFWQDLEERCAEGIEYGVSQGSVLSTTLDIIYNNDLVVQLPQGIKAVMYADDLVLWCANAYATVTTRLLPIVMHVLATWVNGWCVSINIDKCSTTLFTLSQNNSQV